MPTIEPVGYKYGYSEVHPFDDYQKEQHPVFNNTTKDRSKKDIEKWALDTAILSNKSIYAHLVELCLKIPSYFVGQSELSNEWWAKTLYVAERFSGTFGDMFRNFIYGHKDNNGNLDDNIGAEIKEGANPNHSVGKINYQAQTKGKFLVAALGFISPELANDLEWAVVRAFDGVWWRNMNIHAAFGPDFTGRLLNTVFSNSKKSEKDTINFNQITDKIKEYFNNTINHFSSNNKSGGEKKDPLDFYKNAYNLASSFMPIFNCLNIIGDVGRPIARRLGLEGLPRNTLRVLSVIDRPILWFTNIFGFYLPEKHIQKKQVLNDENKHKIFNGLSHSDLLLGSTIADILDFGLIAVEDTIKDSSGSINHIIEIARKVKDSASDIYFSARRKRAAEELLPTQEQKSKENLV